MSIVFLTKEQVHNFFNSRKYAYLLGILGVIIFSLLGLNYSLKLDVKASAASWSSQTSGTSQHLYGVDFVDINTGWAAGNNGTVLKTINGGANWTTLSSGTSAFLLNLDFINANTGWVIGSGGTIRKTTDGGANWAAQTNGNANNLWGIHFIDANTGWIVGDNGVIIKTNNGGTTWSAYNSGTINALRDIYFINGNEGWIVGSGGLILHTSNGGANWTTQTSNTSNQLWGVYFINSTNGWAVGSGGTILKTTNGGTNWTKLSNMVSTAHYDVYFKDINNGWIVGGMGIIYKTNNSGASWSTENSGTVDDLQSLLFFNGNGLAVGNNGTIIERQICGDGAIGGDEECDDSNMNDGDGCSSVCLIESGYECAGEPSVCTIDCGNGEIGEDEECDDGNLNNGDGCSSVCAVEDGYNCSGEPSSCSSVCGDGIIVGGEECDDTNTNNGDGCSSTCIIEPGYECEGEPSECESEDNDGDGYNNDEDECPDENNPFEDENFDGSNPFDSDENGCIDAKGIKEDAATKLEELRIAFESIPDGVAKFTSAILYLDKALDFINASIEEFIDGDPNRVLVTKGRNFFNEEQSAIRKILEIITKGNVTNEDIIKELQLITKKLHLADEIVVRTVYGDAMDEALDQIADCVLTSYPNEQPDSCLDASNSFEKIWMHLKQLETYDNKSLWNCWQYWENQPKWLNCWTNGYQDSSSGSIVNTGNIPSDVSNGDGGGTDTGDTGTDTGDTTTDVNGKGKKVGQNK